jgi:hypothetical protein
LIVRDYAVLTDEKLNISKKRFGLVCTAYGHVHILNTKCNNTVADATV